MGTQDSVTLSSSKRSVGDNAAHYYTVLLLESTTIDNWKIFHTRVVV